MEQAVVSVVVGNGYRLEILASPVLCVDPSVAQDLWPFAGVLRVINTGQALITLTHHTGETGGFSFRGDRVAEPHDPADAAPYDTGPIDFAAGGQVRAVIAPQGFAEVIGDPSYILTAISLAQSGLRPGGQPVGPQEQRDRVFRIEFMADVTLETAAGTVAVQETMPAMLRVIVRDIDHD
jgi:hypothetical protein